MTALLRNTRLLFARPSSSPSGKHFRAKLRTVRIIMTDTITAAAVWPLGKLGSSGNRPLTADVIGRGAFDQPFDADHVQYRCRRHDGIADNNAPATGNTRINSGERGQLRCSPPLRTGTQVPWSSRATLLAAPLKPAKYWFHALLRLPNCAVRRQS